MGIDELGYKGLKSINEGHCMTRDLDLIRKIMLYLEENLNYGNEVDNLTLGQNMQDEENSYKKNCYHIDLIRDANWIKTKGQLGFANDRLYIITGITNNGHDFLDTLRQQDTWNAVKTKAAEIGGFSLSLLLEIGKDYLKKQFGL